MSWYVFLDPPADGPEFFIPRRDNPARSATIVARAMRWYRRMR